MQSELRNIQVVGESFQYKVSEQFIQEEDKSHSYLWLRIYHIDNKNTPFELGLPNFRLFDWLEEENKGVAIINGVYKSVNFNIHQPSFVRAVINEVWQRGWNASESYQLNDGYAFIEHIGYRIEML